MSWHRAAFWALFTVTMAVYLVMVLWSLPKIAQAAGGAMPFDLRPTGYSFEEAHAFLAALTPDANAFYRSVQLRLDLFYPGLLAATLFFAIRALGPRQFPVPPTLLALVALPGAVFDYLENAAVRAMLIAGDDGLTPELVEQAGVWTLLKSVFTTLAVLLLFCLAALALWRRYAAKRETPV